MSPNSQIVSFKILKAYLEIKFNCDLQLKLVGVEVNKGKVPSNSVLCPFLGQFLGSTACHLGLLAFSPFCGVSRQSGNWEHWLGFEVDNARLPFLEPPEPAMSYVGSHVLCKDGTPRLSCKSLVFPDSRNSGGHWVSRTSFSLLPVLPSLTSLFPLFPIMVHISDIPERFCPCIHGSTGSLTGIHSLALLMCLRVLRHITSSSGLTWIPMISSLDPVGAKLNLANQSCWIRLI